MVSRAFLTFGVACLVNTLLLGACARNAPAGAGATAEQCDRSTPGTGKPQKLSHPVKPSACYGVVMMCNHCAYDEEGSFVSSGSQPCGVCVGADF
jgi:hypothetical protein